MSLDTLQIDTPRLVLRVPSLADLDAWTAMMEDPEVARSIGGVMPRAMSWRALMTMIGSWHAIGFAMFSVYESGPGGPIACRIAANRAAGTCPGPP